MSCIESIRKNKQKKNDAKHWNKQMKCDDDDEDVQDELSRKWEKKGTGMIKIDDAMIINTIELYKIR